MNWMRKLLREPTPKPATPASAVPAVTAPRPEDSPDIWVAAVCQVADKALALAWTERLAGDAWLGEVAILGRFSEVRLAASQRIEDSAVLERVAQASRDKDKRVYRCCAERLRQRRQAEEDARRAVKLAVDLRSLLNVAPMHLSRLLDLEKEFRTLGDETSSLSECKGLLDQAQLRLQQDSAMQRDLTARAMAAGILLQECSAEAWSEAAQLHDWRVHLETLAKAQLGLPPWLCGQAASGRLDESLRDIESRLAVLDAEGECILAGELFLASATAHGSSASMDAESAASLAAAWAALGKPKNPLARQSLESRWLALQAPAKSAPAQVELTPPPARIDQGAVRHLFGKLEGAVEQGRLADAEAAEKALDAVLGGASPHGEMALRLQQARAQLGNLRGWARWGTQQAREDLIAAAEQLLISTSSIDDLAQGVPVLREKWKQLNAHGATAKDQWQRFDSALTKAYQPVAARHAEEVARQAAAREAKVVLCVEWECYFSGIVWEHVDYKVLEAQRQDMLRRWRAADQAGFRDERMLRKRLDKLLDGIEQRLEAMHSAELERRVQLIAEAEALGELSDLGRAMTQAKALQERWTRQTMPLRLNRGDQEKLWRRFRAACADVFARRDAQRTQQMAQRDERSQALRDLLDPFAASLENTDVAAIKRDLSRFCADWKAATANSPAADAGLEARARALQQQAQQRIEKLRQERHRTQFELMAKKAALAAGVEAATVALVPSEDLILAAREAWEVLPRLPEKAESLLAERFARASGVTALTLASGREARETMLLDMEIALGLPSPDACSDARRRRQLEHLQSRFGADSRQSPEAEALLVHWYATAAASDAVLDQRMAAVRDKLLEQADRVIR